MVSPTREGMILERYLRTKAIEPALCSMTLPSVMSAQNLPGSCCPMTRPFEPNEVPQCTSARSTEQMRCCALLQT